MVGGVAEGGAPVPVAVVMPVGSEGHVSQDTTLIETPCMSPHYLGHPVAASVVRSCLWV